MSKSTRSATSLPGMKGWSCFEDAQRIETLKHHACAMLFSITEKRILPPNC